MSERKFEQSNDAEYRKGYYDGQHDAFAASELDAYYAGVGFGKREHGDMHMGFNNASERAQFERGIRDKDRHFNAYRAAPLTFWERLFGRKDNAPRIDFTGRKAAKKNRKKAKRAERKTVRAQSRAAKRAAKTANKKRPAGKKRSTGKKRTTSKKRRSGKKRR